MRLAHSIILDILKPFQVQAFLPPQIRFRFQYIQLLDEGNPPCDSQGACPA